MIDLTYLISFILCLIYLLFFIYLTSGWKKKRVKTIEKDDASTFISVVIPFRNELDNLPDLIHSLELQDYSKDLFEIIFVNDHSDDQGFNYLEEEKRKQILNLTIYSLDEEAKFKKAAIQKGVDLAKGPLIISTDADTIRGPKWLSSIASFYEKEKPTLIIAPVSLTINSSFFDRFQLYEFLSMQLITAAFANKGNAILCNGANMAYAKKTFQNVDGYANTPNMPSGDDFFLLLKLKKNLQSSILFLSDKNAIVITKPLANLRQLINQRVRWASKTKYAQNSSIYFTGSVNILFSLWLVLLPIIEFLLHDSYYPSAVFWSMKFLGDYILLDITSKLYGHKINLPHFLITFIVYPFYICAIFILSLFYKPNWKGREI